MADHPVYIGGPRDGEPIDLVEGAVPDETWVLVADVLDLDAVPDQIRKVADTYKAISGDTMPGEVVAHHYKKDFLGRLVYQGPADES